MCRQVHTNTYEYESLTRTLVNAKSGDEVLMWNWLRSRTLYIVRKWGIRKDHRWNLEWLLWVIPWVVRVRLCVTMSHSSCGRLLRSSKLAGTPHTKPHQHHGELHQAGVHHQEGEVPQGVGKPSDDSKLLRGISTGWNEDSIIRGKLNCWI